MGSTLLDVPSLTLLIMPGTSSPLPGGLLINSTKRNLSRMVLMKLGHISALAMRTWTSFPKLWELQVKVLLFSHHAPRLPKLSQTERQTDEVSSSPTTYI